jgi:hypothetical protein
MMRRAFSLLLAAALVTLGLAAAAGLGMDAEAAESEAKAAKREAALSQGKVPVPARIIDAQAETLAPEGTDWLIYDDGTAEQWANSYSTYDAVGNKFTSTWGTFYCDIVRMYMQFTNNTSGYMTAYNGLSGTVLQGYSYISVSPGTTTAWVEVDGSVTPSGWVGNTTYTFQNTAWIGNDFYTSVAVGIDTNGGGAHGFALTAYTGTGYAEQSWDAMVRARFNGDNVPVELMTFSVR